MVLRIHLTEGDIARIRLAQSPDPMWETLLSMHMLQTKSAGAVFGAWWRQVCRELTGPARQLLHLAPPTGYSPDFLTPAAGEGGLEMGIGALMSTPRSRLRADLAELAASGRRLPRWAVSLATGDLGAVRFLAGAVRGYYETALAPYWSSIRTRFDAERAAHARSLASGDLGHLLNSLHPGLSWDHPVLTVRGLPADRDVRLGGRGLLVLPSYFCWHKPTVLRDPGLPPVVVYPMTHDAPLGAARAAGEGPEDPCRRPRPLDALLGRTRAVILGCVATEGCTTTELARNARISPATASHHTAVLRDAGLLSTRRFGSAVLHTLTPLGTALLDGRHLAA